MCFAVSFSVETVQATQVLGAVSEWLASLCVFHLHELSLAIARVTCLHAITWPKAGHCTHRLVLLKDGPAIVSTVVVVCHIAKRVSRYVGTFVSPRSGRRHRTRL